MYDEYDNEYYDTDEYVLEDAFDDGYYQALIDMGIDPDDIVEEDANIFDDDYFDDEAMEATALKKAVVGLLPGVPGVKIPLIIGDIVHNIRINKSVVVSKYDVMNVYGEKKGAEMYEKTVKFFVTNGLLPHESAGANQITFKMLTPEGKKFIHGYYAACDEICQFDFGTAKVHAGAFNKEATAQSVVTGIWVVNNIRTLLGDTFLGKASSVASVIAPKVAGTGVATFVISSLICTTFLVADAVRSYQSSKKFNEVMSKAKEDAFDDGYYQALIDFGYDLDDDAMEDVDIFDEDYFDEAMEGNPENKKKRRAYDYRQAGLTAKEVEAMQAKGREFGEKNYLRKKYGMDKYSANRVREKMRDQDDKITSKLHASRVNRYRNSTDATNHGFNNDSDGWIDRSTHGKKRGGLDREDRLASSGLHGDGPRNKYIATDRLSTAKKNAEAKDSMDRVVGVKKSDKQRFNDMSRAYHRHDGTLSPTPTYYKTLSKHMIEKEKLAKQQARKAKGRQILDKVSSIANTRVPSPREMVRGYRFVDPSKMARTDGFW